jgi:AAA domain-containing protein
MPDDAEDPFAAYEQWRQQPPPANGGQGGPIVLIDAGEDDPIPPREWLLGTVFCRGFLSALISTGGTGKTALRIAQAMSVAIGRSLTGEHVHHQGRVLYITLEDCMAELRRRVRACRIHHGVDPAELKGWMLLWAPPGSAKLAEKPDKSNAIITGTLEAQLRSIIVKNCIDLVNIDPFIKTYAGDIDENSNSAIDAVCEIIIRLSLELNFAPDLLHHDSKAATHPGDTNRGRGASAFRDAGRLVYTATVMSPDEAKTFDIPESERRDYFRVDSAKVNLARAADARWFHLVGIRIENGTPEYPNGDTVQTVEPWSPPETWEGLSHDALNAALTEIDAGMPNGQRYSDASSAGKRAAWPIVQKHCPDKSEPQCREIIRTWVKNGVLFNQSYDDPVERKSRQGLHLNPAKRPS